MLTGGLQKLTTLDFPGVVSSIVFTKGCNFRCPYCHNPELVALGFYLKNTASRQGPAQPLNGDNAVTHTEAAGVVPCGQDNTALAGVSHSGNARPEDAAVSDSAPSCPLEPRAEMEELFSFLRKRQGLIDGLVISGGEPCLQPDLPDFCREARKLGYKIKLDTNGSRPAMLQKLLDAELLDYVAMDLKTLPELYGKYGFCSESDISAKIARSINILHSSGVPHEYRTTCVAPYVDMEIISGLTCLVAQGGLNRTDAMQTVPSAAKIKWFFQQARLENVLSPNAPMNALSEPEIAELVAEAAKKVPLASTRQ